jgi:hypothetical protein
MASSPSAAAPRQLPDSTAIESWQLGNGLRVVTHDIPRSKAVAITVAYPVGTDGDPPSRRGLAQLMAEVQMMAPAGDVPERSREEMESLRPLGWSIKVNRRATQLAEVATVEQFPGALRQMAIRMRGVRVDHAALKAAVATVRHDQGEHLFGSVDNALYFQAREYANGADPRAVLDLAAVKGLDGVTAQELERRLREAFIPAGAVLAIAGDLGGVNVHALVESQFGTLPGGTPPSSQAARPGGPVFRPSFHSIARADLDQPVGVLALNAPALTDSGHPGFFLSMLLIGQHCHQSWTISRYVKTRFRYSLLDEPDLVRLYPATAPDSAGPRALSNELHATLRTLLGMIVVAGEYNELRYNVLWLLGGPMPQHVLSLVRSDGAALNNVCNNLAARELMGGEAFWGTYRRRFAAGRAPDLAGWLRYLDQPEHQAGLLFTPLHR